MQEISVHTKCSQDIEKLFFLFLRIVVVTSMERAIIHIALLLVRFKIGVVNVDQCHNKTDETPRSRTEPRSSTCVNLGLADTSLMNRTAHSKQF